jgi:hypothetical protein
MGVQVPPRTPLLPLPFLRSRGRKEDVRLKHEGTGRALARVLCLTSLCMHSYYCWTFSMRTAGIVEPS